MDKEKIFAVFGNPIRHSLSPVIHAAFADQFSISLKYTAELIESHDFKDSVERFFAAGGCGINVTVPFKSEAFLIAEKISQRADRARAANTLLNKKNAIECDNTDGAGLVCDLKENLSWVIKSKRILVIGAGGAAQGILEALLKEDPVHIHIANRTKSKAIDLARQFSDLGSVEGAGIDDIVSERYDLVFNATSAGVKQEPLSLPTTLVSEKVYCYDLAYGSAPTEFINWAAERNPMGLTDGLGMLVEQAAESFFLWHGVRPNTKLLLNQLRANQLS